MGLLLIVEVMNEIGDQPIPAGVMGWCTSVIRGIALVAVIGHEDQGIHGGRLNRNDRAHHRALGRWIAPSCPTRTDTGTGITKGSIAI